MAAAKSQSKSKSKKKSARKVARKVTRKTARKAAKRVSKKSAKKTTKRTLKKGAAKKVSKKVSKKSTPRAVKKPTAGKAPRRPVASGAGADEFMRITRRMTRAARDVTEGPMMSSPGIRWKGRVFAFYWNEQMVFRLGRDFDPAAAGIRNWKPLNPFKSKPPLPGWFVLPVSEEKRWDAMADRALENMRTA